MARGTLIRSGMALACAMLLTQSGCILIQSSHVDGDAARAPSCSADAQVAASASYRFQRNGSEMPQVANATASDFRTALDGSGVFSSVDYAGRGRTHVEVVANNKANVAGAFGIGFLSGLTFGLIGTKVTDDYEIAVTLTTPGRSPETLSFERKTVSRSGLIKPGAGDGFRDVPDANAAYRSHLRETVNAALGQWVEQGVLCSGPRSARPDARVFARAFALVESAVAPR